MFQDDTENFLNVRVEKGKGERGARDEEQKREGKEERKEEGGREGRRKERKEGIRRRKQ